MLRHCLDFNGAPMAHFAPAPLMPAPIGKSNGANRAPLAFFQWRNVSASADASRSRRRHPPLSWAARELQ